MTFTRRSFFRQTLIAGPAAMTFWVDAGDASAQDQCTLPQPGNAEQFIPNEPKVGTRYSALEMKTRPELAKFQNAFCKIRALPSNDVIGWDKQIAQHCIHCSPPPGTGTTNIHYTWAFLPWHRGLLYFLERILRNLSQNDDFRLVYWDWESTHSRTLPAIYAVQNPDCLYWSNRRTTGSNWPLPAAKVDVSALLGTPHFPAFGGSASQPGATYSGPHANVHNAFAPGDMGNLMYSPRDPVFYAHHGNIDRLWSSWLKAGGSNPDFGDAKAYFYDENRKWRYILFNDLRDETKLGYQYSSYMKPAAPVPKLHEFTMTLKGTMRSVESAALGEITKAKGPRFLIVEGISNLGELPPDTLNFGIFADNPPVGTQSSSDKGFLGQIATVHSEGHDHVGPAAAALNVTGKLPGLLKANKGGINLRVAPLDDSGKTTGPSIPITAANVSIVE